MTTLQKTKQLLSQHTIEFDLNLNLKNLHAKCFLQIK